MFTLVAETWHDVEPINSNGFTLFLQSTKSQDFGTVELDREYIANELDSVG